ncbi:MAG: hypothetical protein OXI96_04045 [Acidimicrobiaceae bacterium]|nr:hypothetical protein [Acidimicrobiaceae bacterium]
MTSVSVSQRITHYVAALSEDAFVAVRDVNGSRSAVESAFSRLAANGKLTRIRKGIYWKGTITPLGISLPSVEKVALFLGGPGSGPAGVAAAHWLGLTSQIPSTYLTAVPGRAPAPWQQIKFTQRPIGRLLTDMSPSEVAVLEVLRSGPAVVETDWEQLGAVVVQLAENEHVRTDVLHDAANDEPHRGTRTRWIELCRSQPELMPKSRTCDYQTTKSRLNPAVRDLG